MLRQWFITGARMQSREHDRILREADAMEIFKSTSIQDVLHILDSVLLATNLTIACAVQTKLL